MLARRKRERRGKINRDCLFEVLVVVLKGVGVILVRYHAERTIELPSVASDDYDFR